MTIQPFHKLQRIVLGGLLALVLSGTAARADGFYIAPSMGVGVSAHQFDTRALAGPGRLRDSARGPGGSLGLALGRRSQIAGRQVDLELDLRASAAERYHSGSRSYTVTRQQIGLAAYTTVLHRGGVTGQIGVGAGARRLDITVTDGGLRRRDVDREPYGMLALRGLWRIDDRLTGFAELRYSVHPAPKRAGSTAAIEHEMDAVALHVGVQMTLGE